MRAYRVAYDGRPFHGFQRQPDVPTVEDAVFDALRDLGVLDADADKPDGYAAAGRTDAGVSALSQTVAFEAPEWLAPRALNADLPATVRAWASADVSPDFHATHDARWREYTYFLYAPAGEEGPASDGDGSASGGEGLTGDCGVASARSLDDARAAAVLDRLAGEHDFHNLTPDETGTVRDLETGLEREGDLLVVRLRAGGFARQLVRRVVGLVTEVASGAADVSTVDRVLAAEPLAGPDGVGPVPADGLVLADVRYDGVDFEVDEEAVASARAAFGERHARAATAAAVTGRVRDGIGREP